MVWDSSFGVSPRRESGDDQAPADSTISRRVRGQPHSPHSVASRVTGAGGHSCQGQDDLNERDTPLFLSLSRGVTSHPHNKHCPSRNSRSAAVSSSELLPLHLHCHVASLHCISHIHFHSASFLCCCAVVLSILSSPRITIILLCLLLCLILRGLLLHRLTRTSGPPGVGKTLTAQALAHHYRRPLYSVSQAHGEHQNMSLTGPDFQCGLELGSARAGRAIAPVLPRRRQVESRTAAG